MTFLGRLGGGLLFVIAALLLMGLLVEPRWRVEQSVVIDLPPERIFPHLDAPRRWRSWAGIGDGAGGVEGPVRGVGAALVWGGARGTGRLEIVESRARRSVTYRLQGGGLAAPSGGNLSLDDVAAGTRVTWQVWGEAGADPVSRLVMLAVRHRVRAGLRRGLARLRSHVGAAASDAR